MRMGLYPIVQKVLRLRFGVCRAIVAAGEDYYFPRLVDLNSRAFLAGGQLDRTHGSRRISSTKKALRSWHFSNSMIPRL
jgi:hypothetical protein